MDGHIYAPSAGCLALVLVIQTGGHLHIYKLFPTVLLIGLCLVIRHFLMGTKEPWTKICLNLVTGY